MYSPRQQVGGVEPSINVTRPNVARMYDYYLGGKDNYAVDRECADEVIRRVPEIVEMARANRAFLGRAVRFVAGELGIGQFLDIGAGLPTRDNVHQVAQRTNPAARVVYVDRDPLVLVHARAILARDVQTRVIVGDVRRPGAILDDLASDPEVGGLLDLSRPVAVLHFIPDEDGAYEAVRALVEAMAPGSCLVLSHIEHRREFEDAATQYERANAPAVLRSVKEIARFFDGLELVAPGLVNVRRWRPDDRVLDLDRDVPFYGAVGVKR